MDQELKKLLQDAGALPEGVRSLLAELLMRRNNAHAVQDMTALLSSGVDLQLLLHDIMGRIADLLGASRAQVLTIIEDQDIFYLMGDSQDSMAVWMPVPRSRYPEISAVTHSGQEMILRQGEEDPALRHVLQQRRQQELAIIPLYWEREVFGVLEVWFESQGQVCDPFLDVLRQLSSLLGHTLHDSELYSYMDEQRDLTSVSLADEDPVLPMLGKYREFFQRAFDGILVLDQENRVIHINLAGEQMTGYSRRDLVGSSLADIVVEQDRVMLGSVLREVRAEGSARSFDLGLVTTSGDFILVAISTSAVLAEDEVVVLSFRDITEARALENELRTTKDFLERLIDSTVDAIIATNVQNTVILFNNGAERIFGMKASSVLDTVQFSMLFGSGESERVITRLHSEEYGPPGRLEALRTMVLNAEQEELTVSLSASLLLEDDRQVGMVVVISDLTEGLAMERRLMQAQEKLVLTEKQALIAELAGTTAHELNQPLTSIMGYAELLQRRMDDDDSNLRAVETILREAERMAEIVRKIGRITRYETKSYVGGAQILDLEKSSE